MGGDKWWHVTASGIVGGVCCVYAGQPFDTVKVRLQTQPVADAAQRVFKGPLDCFIKSVRNEGVRALYKGSSAALASVVVENAVLFTANGFIKQSFLALGLGNGRGELSLGQTAIAGGLAGVFSSTAICPAEVIKCNLQVQMSAARTAIAPASFSAPALTTSPVLKAAAKQAGRFLPGLPSLSRNAALAVSSACVPANIVTPTAATGPVDLARLIVRRDGVRGLFKGLPSLWARDIPFNFAFLGSYEAFCGLFAWATESDRRALNPLPTLAAGGLAGMAGWSVVFPMDVVKSRTQTGTTGQSTLTVARTILQKEGPRAFYRGWSAAVARAFPANAALLLGYELSHRLFRSA
jgi:hypothetical protein